MATVTEQIDRMREQIEWRRKEADKDEATLEAFEYSIPGWLLGMDVSWLCPVGENSLHVVIRGDMDTVKVVQRATGQLLKCTVEEVTGSVTFESHDLKWDDFRMWLQVKGDLDLAPGCRLVPYETTVTRFKVECPDATE